MPVAEQYLGAEATICNYADYFQTAWDDYVTRHPDSTVFHLTAWKRVAEKIFGCKGRYLFVEEDSKIRGVLPLFEVSSPLQGRSLISVPFAVYGGACADNERIASMLRAHACRLAKQEGFDFLELRDQQPISDRGFHTKKLYYRFYTKLPNNPEELLQSFPRDTRYMIRKAQKNGLQAIVGPQHLDAFYEIFSRSYHNLGTPVFPKGLFKAVIKEFGDKCELTTIWHNSVAIAGVLTFRFRDWTVPYFGGSVIESRPLAANNFMYWEVMKHGLLTGARFFDFGRSKEGTGAYSFKTQWNMQVHELQYHFFLARRKTMPNFSPANPKFSLPISLWKAMPLSMTKVLGPAVVRWFP